MGCCGSKDSAKDPVVPKRAKGDQPLVDTEIYTSLVPVSDINTHASVASWPLNKAAYTKTGLWSGDHYVLAAVWEGHNGREVAEFANRKCHETFSRCLAANGNLVDDALRKTFTDIDHSFFESQISAEIKASVGATGMVLYIDVHTKTVWVARLGRCSCLVGQSIGGFTQVTTEVLLLSHDDRPIERRISSSAPPTPGTRPPTGLPTHTPVRSMPSTPTKGGTTTPVRTSQYVVQDGSEDPNPNKRALGFGYGKIPSLTEVHNRGKAVPAPTPSEREPYIKSSCHVTSHQLTPSDRHVLLTTQGLLSLVAPLEAALLAASYCSNQVAPLQARTIGVRAHTAPLARPPDPTSGNPTAAAQPTLPERWDVNVAGLIVRRALHKCMDAYNSSHPESQNVTWGDLHLLSNTPIKDPLFHPSKKAPSLPATPSNSFSRARTPDNSFTHKQDGPFSVDRQVAVMVLELNWPQEEANVARPPTSRPTNAWAKYRWGLVGQYARFLMHRRRQIHKLWDATIAAALRQAKADARNREIAQYRAQVALAGATGDVTSAADRSPARRPPTPSRKARGGTPIKDPKKHDLRGGSRTPSRPGTPVGPLTPRESGELAPTTLVY